MYNDIAYFVRKQKTGTKDQYGDDVFELVKSQVFVKVESVTRSEFYTAQAAGYDPKISFSIADYYDYAEQPFIEYNDVLYKIIRTYRTGIGLQVVCQHVDEVEE